MNNPDTTGPYRFEGIRHDRNRSAIVHISDLVQVRRVLVGRQFELAVALFGKAKVFPLRNFEGEWRKVTASAGEAKEGVSDT